MSPQTTHPLVARYLAELDGLLRDIEPVERAEVVTGVHEHVESALDGTARTEADVRAALAEVGPATAVAEEAYAGRPLPASTAPMTLRAWVPSTVATLQTLGLLLVLLVSLTRVAITSSSTVTESSGGRRTVSEGASVYVGSAWDAIPAVMVTLPFWMVVCVLVAICGLWRPAEKAALVLLLPASAFALSGLPALGDAVVGVDGVTPAAYAALALVVLGGGGALVVLVRRALRRSRGVAARS